VLRYATQAVTKLALLNLPHCSSLVCLGRFTSFVRSSLTTYQPPRIQPLLCLARLLTPSVRLCHSFEPPHRADLKSKTCAKASVQAPLPALLPHSSSALAVRPRSYSQTARTSFPSLRLQSVRSLTHCTLRPTARSWLFFHAQS
jgi:hypothetical protein